MKNKEAAYTRLNQTGRKCDGCGSKIGRWTSKCWYDETWDRCYCSAGGCAEQVISAPLCRGSCMMYLNPFQLDASEVYGIGQMCSACSAKVGGEGDALEGLKVVSTERLPHRTKTAVEDGPYVVIEQSPGFYQIIRPIRRGVRAVRGTDVYLERAFKRCVKFNQE